MNIFTALWILIGAAFLAVEIPAVVRKERGDTLTDHVRALMQYKSFKAVFSAFWVWLTLHFFAPGLGL